MRQSSNLSEVVSAVSNLLGDGPIVLPALLLCDFGHLADEVARLEAAGAKAIHLDVMDGRFVPQLTYGMVVVEAVRRAATVPIEVHLMIEEPDQTAADYARAGADIVTVHVEGLADPEATLAAIAAAGSRAHLAISPGTPVERVEPFLAAAAGVLVMSVEPGYGGQAFQPAALDKLTQLRLRRAEHGLALRLGIDGGIAAGTIAAAARAGAELIVAGSAVIRSGDYAAAIRELQQIAREEVG
ncbi:MAG: Ribulose-phosphate 3-epimerase [Planctomycetota bacterium]